MIELMLLLAAFLVVVALILGRVSLLAGLAIIAVILLMWAVLGADIRTV